MQVSARRGNARNHRKNARNRGGNAHNHGKNARKLRGNARNHGENAHNHGENARNHRENAALIGILALTGQIPSDFRRRLPRSLGHVKH